MAQAGYTPILIYASSTPGALPSAANLSSSASGAELAINYADGKLYFKNSSGVVTLLAGSSSGPAGGSNTQVQYNSSGVLAGSSNLTFDGTSLTLGGNPTLSAGTANGVLYLNGSKVATSGSALVFNGTRLDVNTGTTGPSISVQGGAGAGNEFSMGADSSGGFWQQLGGLPVRWFVNGSEQMRLTSTGLGIGTSSPAAKLDVLGLASSIGLKIRGGGNSGINILDIADAGGSGSLVLNASGNLGIGTSSPGYRLTVAGPGSSGNCTISLVDTSNSNKEYRIDQTSGQFRVIESGVAERLILTGGNLGLGVTPSAWSSAFKAFQFGTIGALAWNGSTDVYLSTNYASIGGVSKYIDNGYAALYGQSAGTHAWYTAPSGTAGNTITFTQAMALDASGRWMLGTTSPFNAIGASIQSQSGTWAAGIHLRGPSVSNGCYFAASTSSTTTDFEIWNEQNGYLRFATNNTERARITSGGNFKIGGTADRGTTEGDKQLVLFNGTAPVGTLTNGISLYSSSGEAYVMDAAGNATLFSPHDRDTNEWIFRSKHTPSGKVLKIDVERLLRFVNDHFGLDAVQEFIEP